MTKKWQTRGCYFSEQKENEKTSKGSIAVEVHSNRMNLVSFINGKGLKTLQPIPG